MIRECFHDNFKTKYRMKVINNNYLEDIVDELWHYFIEPSKHLWRLQAEHIKFDLDCSIAAHALPYK